MTICKYKIGIWKETQKNGHLKSKILPKMISIGPSNPNILHILITEQNRRFIYDRTILYTIEEKGIINFFFHLV